MITTLLPDGASAETADELAGMIQELHPAATRVALRAFAEADLREVLAHIEVPTLLVYGEQDVRAPRQVWEPLHATIPGCSLVVLPGLGHMVDMEAAERFNAELRRFLRATRR